MSSHSHNHIQEAFLQGSEVDFNYFAPDQARFYKEHLLWIFYHTNGTIQAAFYRLTDKDIANALIGAHQRGVRVEVVLDPGAINSKYSLAHQLFKAGITLYRYQPTGLLPPFPRTFPSIMHHKSIIFTDVIGGFSLVACGSLNFTNAGFNGNREQMQIRSRHTQDFLHHFQLLKEASEQISEQHFIRPSKIMKKIKNLVGLRRFLHKL